MPNIDGLETTRLIRELLPLDEQPYIVAISGRTSKEQRERCLAAGMDDFIGKPFSDEEMAVMLAKRFPNLRS